MPFYSKIYIDMSHIYLSSLDKLINRVTSEAFASHVVCNQSDIVGAVWCDCVVGLCCRAVWWGCVVGLRGGAVL